MEAWLLEKITRYSVNSCVYCLAQGHCSVCLNILLQIEAEATQAWL